MVEFENVESAKRAKQSLNGADVYSGCCTLKIEFAKVNLFMLSFNNKIESFIYLQFEDPQYRYSIDRITS